ncbi:MAG: nitroreductase family protein [Bacilli bacterium]|nr:nitroreductase family protein [Bacilli bacterium]MBN2876031.1 nitroreductase family protein [Bacilli bacterium]
MNETVNVILKRRSVRDYKPDMITEEELNTIVECGLYAPSAKNKQNWHFTVVTNKDKIEEMNRLALEGMERLGIEKEDNFHIFYHAPVVIVISSKIEGYSEINAGCAIENMALGAKAMGIGSCIIGETRYMYHQANKADIDRVLKIPENYEHDISICFGYPALEEDEAKPRKENVVDYIL